MLSKAEAYEVLVNGIRYIFQKNGLVFKDNDVINDIIDAVMVSDYVEVLEAELREDKIQKPVQPELPFPGLKVDLETCCGNNCGDEAVGMGPDDNPYCKDCLAKFPEV